MDSLPHATRRPGCHTNSPMAGCLLSPRLVIPLHGIYVPVLLKHWQGLKSPNFLMHLDASVSLILDCSFSPSPTPCPWPLINFSLQFLFNFGKFQKAVSTINTHVSFTYAHWLLTFCLLCAHVLSMPHAYFLLLNHVTRKHDDMLLLSSSPYVS